MIIGYLILVLLLAYGAKRRNVVSKTGIDYLSSADTLPIKGLFTVIIFFSHISSYLNSTICVLDEPFFRITREIGQLMVAPFFFFSGYGITRQIEVKKEKYIKTFPKKRLFSTWYHFALIVCLFTFLSFVFNNRYSLAEYLLAFTGWTSIGNSNWFMFDTFLLYIIVIIVFNLKRDFVSKKPAYYISSIVFLAVITLYFLKETWWWNTLLCFPAGMMFAKYKDDIDRMFDKLKYKQLDICVTILVFGFFYILNRVHRVFFLGYAVVFCMLLVGILKRVSFNSKVLSFFGKHVFSIYCLQRATFMIFEKMTLNSYLLFMACFVTTVGLAILFDLLCEKTDKLILQ